MKKFGLLFLVSLLAIVLPNCSPKVAFKQQSDDTTLGSTGDNGNSAGDDGSLPGPTPDPGNDNSTAGSGEFTEQFKVSFNSESAPLDMFWVIDNSGSMNEEAALVRSNFEAFLTELNKSTNFRFLLLSLENVLNLGLLNGVSIPAGFDPNTHYQINQFVDSRNGPQLLLSALGSAPAGFLRSNSKKIIVFVTDDNSQLPATDFMNSLTTSRGWSAKDVSVFSFIGQSRQLSPCMAAEGVVYKDLAAQTGGKTYNICNTNWSTYFSDLTTGSVSKAVRRFSLTLAGSVSQILEVKVDGQAISSGSYSLSGKTLTLADSVNLAENSQVVVRYK